MDTLIILITPLQTKAVLEILSLLAVAAIIGYVTAWLFYRSYYKRKLKTVETEKNELLRKYNHLETEKNGLQNKFHEKDKQLNYQTVKLNALKSLSEDNGLEKQNGNSTQPQKEQWPSEQNKHLHHIAQRKHLLDYNSFGTASMAEKDNLKMISGIGVFIEERLHALDIFTFRQISQFTERDIATIHEAIEYFSGRIERDEWVAQAKELVQSKDKRMKTLQQISLRKSRLYYDRIGVADKEEVDDLTIISGIGGWIQEKLNALDIYTFRQISNFTNEDIELVTDAMQYFPGRIERDEWVHQATELVRLAGKKDELLRRIEARKDNIYYNRLGIAHKHEANNLTLIHGIELWIEERLNTLDIYTYKQLSKLTSEDIGTIAGILEISKERINKDQWVAQALELERKQLLNV